MSIVLGPNQYGKAENRVFRVYRENARHEIRDLNVSTSLRGEFAAAHLTGDQSDILPTDTQKNTAFAYAKEHPIDSIEQWGQILGAHFLDATPKATGARIEIHALPSIVIDAETHRIEVDGSEHDHSFIRRGYETRTTVVTVEGRGADQQVWVVSGLRDLVLLKTTGSEFRGFRKDEYTILPETTDRIMATSLVARWRYTATDLDFDATYAQIKGLLGQVFAQVHSLALQQTLFAMGRGSRRSSFRPPTSTITWSICPRTGWRTPARCSSPPIARTG